MRARSAVLALAAVLGALLALAVVPAGPARAASGPLHWRAPVLAEHAVTRDATQLSAVGCSYGALYPCVAVGAHGTAVTLNGTQPIVWHGVAGGADLTHVGCAAWFCVATTATALLRNTGAFASPGPWRQVATAPAGESFAGISCADQGPCVAWAQDGAAEVSVNGRTWQPETIVPAGSGLSVSSLVCATIAAGARSGCIASLTAPGVSTGRFASAKGTGAWKVGADGDVPPLTAMACGENNLTVAATCVGTTAGGAVATTGDPGDAHPQWTVAGVIPAGSGAAFAGVACSSSTLCVAPLVDGRVATITPGATTLSSGPVDPSGFVAGEGVACRQHGPCLIPDRTPGLATVTLGAADPTATIAPGLGVPSITGLACPSRRLCVATDGAGAILRTPTPGGPAIGWLRTEQPSAGAGLLSLACPSARLCVAGGVDDEMLTSTAPGTGRRWRRLSLPFSYRGVDDGEDPDDINALACPATRLCVAIAAADPSDGYPSQTGLIASARPAGSASTWKDLRVPAAGGLACASARLCVAGSTRRGRIVVSTHPDRGRRAWPTLTIGTTAIESVACPTARLCVAGDHGGALHWSTHPARGARAWHTGRLGSRPLVALTCRSAHLCVALDGAGHAWSTSRPTGGARAWHATALDATPLTTPDPSPAHLTALTCAPVRPCLVGTSTGAVFPGATG